jgi:hypothetical protein
MDSLVKEAADPLFHYLSYNDSISFAQYLSSLNSHHEYKNTLAKTLSKKCFEEISSNTFEVLRMLYYIVKICFEKKMNYKIKYDWIDIQYFSFNNKKKINKKLSSSKQFLKQSLMEIYVYLGCHKSSILKTRKSLSLSKKNINFIFNCKCNVIDTNNKKHSFTFELNCDNSDIHKIYKKRTDIMKNVIDKNQSINFHDILNSISLVR